MVALATLIIFFAVLLLIFLAAAVVLALWVWFRKRRVGRAANAGILLERIDESADRIKNQLFIISIVLALFVVAPFLALLMILNG